MKQSMYSNCLKKEDTLKASTRVPDKTKSHQVHVDGMSCHKLGTVHQAISPSNLNHFTLWWGSKLSTVSALHRGKK